ncbi:GMC oxidoreductase [Longimicrobium sp.]|uniref:GMC oxidoreductase n=1 Tax=Longimicrobium sp. TaxID=2029185 RepID=UPI002E33BDB0|nr:GMC oxidoreductase [Longimicrobium sp.]HEX6037990.1 GMC oxidoreductase [Longimicrobium sp.]
MKTATSAPNFNYGFPTPGPQNPTGQDVMNHVFFLSQSEWKRVREEEQFDYIVIGSGFCALAFVERTLRQNPDARILVLERGSFFLPEHFQNLPLPFQRTLGGLSETFPWTLSARTVAGEYIRWQHGMVPFVGGRSTLWSAWCPRPTREEMEGWPEPVIAAANKYFPEAESLLNVIPADEIDRGRNAPPPEMRPIYGILQHELTRYLREGLDRIPSATRAMSAPLAAGARELHGVDFQKFSTPGPLLAVCSEANLRAKADKGAPLRIATDCTVTRVLQQDGRATALDTTRGMVNVGNAKLILAMGTLPPTTLVLNSFPQVERAGERFTAHFITSVVARVRRTDYDFHEQIGELELAAIYMAGMNPETRGQYHIQLTALSDRFPVKNAQAAARHMPDVVATASPAQLLSSEDYVVFVCAVLGELDYRNEDTWFRRNDDGVSDPTTNVMLQVTANEADMAVWDTMDEGTFQALERVLSPRGAQGVEYWHGDQDVGTWKSERPSTGQIRVPALVHEGSTLWIGEDDDAPVDLDYRLRGVENVYVTGGALWPTSGSWNPTMTMVALAQHLADSLCGREIAVPLPPTAFDLEATHGQSALT